MEISRTHRLSQTFFVTSLQQKTVFIGYRRQSSLLKAIASKLFLGLDASPVRMAGKVNVCIATVADGCKCLDRFCSVVLFDTTTREEEQRSILPWHGGIERHGSNPWRPLQCAGLRNHLRRDGKMRQISYICYIDAG